MKRLALLLSMILLVLLSGCAVIDLILPPQSTLMPTVSSPFPAGRAETMAIATLTAMAHTAQPATPIPGASAAPGVTPVPGASATAPQPSPSAIPASPTPVPVASRTASPTPSGKPYAVSAVGPLYTANFANPSKGCAWQGVAGQVLRTNGDSVSGLVVVVTGQLGGAKLDQVSVTGSAKVYGPGGYEIVLGNNPLASTKMVFIQVFDTAGSALTVPYAFDTFSTCSKNLAIINFQEVR